MFTEDFTQIPCGLCYQRNSRREEKSRTGLGGQAQEKNKAGERVPPLVVGSRRGGLEAVQFLLRYSSSMNVWREHGNYRKTT